ncbi:MAG TPA: hypothetical protein VME46_04995 [Acidimicrobiales bacterium]|nr:hypothetical protein [Acidimicrobiales bacterium]
MRTHAWLSRFVFLSAALLCSSASPAMAQTSLSHAATPQDSVLQLLPGDWLGPFPAPPGECAGEYLEWFIYRTGSYTSTWNSYPKYGTNGCGGATAYGRWSARGDVLMFWQQSVPNCGECTQRKDIPVYFHFLTANDVRFCDYPDANDGCWVYHRQKS